MTVFANLVYHIVFSTKDRQNIISYEIEESLYSYIGGIIRGQNGKLIAIGGVENHIHILAKFRQTITIQEMLRHIKSDSSRWLNNKEYLPTKFNWQRNYGVFSVSESMVSQVKNYICNQKEHHQKLTFEDELLFLLKKHKIHYHNNHIWK